MAVFRTDHYTPRYLEMNTAARWGDRCKGDIKSFCAVWAPILQHSEQKESL